MQLSYFLFVALLATLTCGDKLRAECDAMGKYTIPNFKGNWFKAMEYCHYLGLKLTTLFSLEEQRLVEQSIAATDKGNDTTLWIGGNDLSDSENYHWYSTGNRITWFNWFTCSNCNRGYERDGNCLHLVYQEDAEEWRWKLARCHENKYFICERL